MKFVCQRGACCAVGAWAAATLDQNQWIQVDFISTHRILSVTTQGRPANSELVTSYYVSYSQDGANWMDIATLYDGNVDSDTKRTNYLPAFTEARFLRLRPHAWSTQIAMRFDVTGCKVTSKLLCASRVSSLYFAEIYGAAFRR